MRFSEYVEADLRRNFQLEVSDDLEPTRAQLWKRVLSPRFAPVLLIRLAKGSQDCGLRPFAKLFSFLNFSWFGIEVGLGCEIGPGLYLPHTMGTVIGAKQIGSNVMIYNGVTLGAKRLDIRFTPSLRPILEDNVVVGTGAKVLGGITIGKGSTVGANSVVTSTISSDSTVVGNPARVIGSKPDDGSLIMSHANLGSVDCYREL